MIRIVIFLAAATVIATGVVWFADRPGEVAITWLGYRLETSVGVAIAALIVLVIALIFIWTVVRAIVRSPEQVSLFLRHRRAIKGYLAISRGLIAIGAGDLRIARRSADEAARLSPGDPLALLLTAQSAQMAGERTEAERAFRVMAERDDTKLLGLRGLYVEAQRRNDMPAARLAAEEAAKAQPTLAWAGEAVLDYRCAASDWAGAIDALDSMKKAFDKAEYRRKRAVLLTARAMALEDSDRDASRLMALEAVKLAPDLVPAAALAGKRLAEAGEARKAGKILETAWKTSPHPDIAEAYANLRFGDSARDRLTRMEKLAAKTPNQIEGALAVAHAALDAREFSVARGALSSYASAPTRRVATLMAEIEELEHGDEGRVREWMSRAMRAAPDPAWTADGAISDRWLPVSPSGRLDAFTWKVPLAEIGMTRPVIDAMPPATPSASPPLLPSEKAARRATKSKSAVKSKATEPVIPLVHAPDDPGPDSTLEIDPVPEPTLPPANQAWQRIRQLFRELRS